MIIVEENSLTPHGLQYICMLRKTHRCGYVEIKKGSVLYGKDYTEPLMSSTDYSAMEDLINVHGGVTYAGYLFKDLALNLGYLGIEDDRFYIGFDCAHSFDAEIDSWSEIEKVCYDNLKPHEFDNVMHMSTTQQLKKYLTNSRFFKLENIASSQKDIGYVRGECLKMSEQIVGIEKKIERNQNVL